MSRTKQHQAVFLLTLLIGCALFFIASLIFPDSAYAQIPTGGIIPQCDWEHNQTYGLGAFVLLASNVMKLIWGITGSLALLMFVWGGFQWLTAAGEESRVKAGWDTFINATIGIAIILGSWVIINTLMLFLISPGSFTAAKLFDRADDWVTIATEKNTVCIDSAKLATGTVPIPVGAPASGGTEGTCCYVIGGTPESAQLTRGDCTQRIASGIGPSVTSYYCPGGASIDACGSKARVYGGPGGEVWNSSCAGRISITRVQKNGRCEGGSGNELVCESGTVCQAASMTNEKKCIAEDEEVVCCKIAEGTLQGSASIKDEFGFFEGATTRSACRSDRAVPAGGIYGGQKYDYVYKKTLMCPKASHSSCPAGLLGFAINPITDSDCIWIP